MVYIKNTSDENIAVYLENEKFTFYSSEVIEIIDEKYKKILENNRVFKKYIDRGKLLKVSKPEIKKVETLEIEKKVLENKVKEKDKVVAEKEKKIEDMEKEILDLKAKLNAKAKKNSKIEE